MTNSHVHGFSPSVFVSYVVHSDLDIVVRLDGSHHARAGDALRLVIDPAIGALFNAVTGKSLI